MSSSQKGFTLLELMMVVAIVSILAVIALPAYFNFTARSQVAEGVALASELKTSISEYYEAQGSFPAADVYNLGVSTRYTQSVTHDDSGVITITLRNSSPVSASAQGFTLTLSPTVTGNKINNWVCETTGNTNFLPSGCAH